MRSLWYIQMDAVLQVGEQDYSPLAPSITASDLYVSNFERRQAANDNQADAEDVDQAGVFIPQTDQCSQSLSLV